MRRADLGQILWAGSSQSPVSRFPPKACQEHGCYPSPLGDGALVWVRGMPAQAMLLRLPDGSSTQEARRSSNQRWPAVARDCAPLKNHLLRHQACTCRRDGPLSTFTNLQTTVDESPGAAEWAAGLWWSWLCAWLTSAHFATKEPNLDVYGSHIFNGAFYQTEEFAVIRQWGVRSGKNSLHVEPDLGAGSIAEQSSTAVTTTSAVRRPARRILTLLCMMEKQAVQYPIEQTGEEH